MVLHFFFSSYALAFLSSQTESCLQHHGISRYRPNIIPFQYCLSKWRTADWQLYLRFQITCQHAKLISKSACVSWGLLSMKSKCSYSISWASEVSTLANSSHALCSNSVFKHCRHKFGVNCSSYANSLVPRFSGGRGSKLVMLSSVIKIFIASNGMITAQAVIASLD